MKLFQAALSSSVLVLAVLGSMLTPAEAAAQSQRSFVHIVAPGETLASLAQHYYGDPLKENVLVVENGLTSQGGSDIVVGMRLIIPWVAFHQVQEGDTWFQLSQTYYGDERRAFLLVDENDGSLGDQPDPGEELIIPYPLRFTADQNENLRRIAQQFYNNESTNSIRLLRRFNNMRGIRPHRGQVILVPLSDLRLSQEGREMIEAVTGERLEVGERRALQQRIDEQLPELAEHLRRGRFAEAISLGNQFLGSGALAETQVVSIQKELGTAYVAVDRPDLAVAAFRAALSHKSALELDVQRTSPTVLRAFRQAQLEDREAREVGAADDAGTDAGADAGTSDE